MTSGGYDTVVLDLGNVLVGWDPARALTEEMTPQEWERFAEAADFRSLNLAADAGMPIADVAARAAALDPAHGRTLSRYFANFAATLTGPVPGTTAVVEELAAAGIRLLGLTNWSAETFHHAAGAAPVIDLLEGVVVSGREGVAKPDPAVFRIVLERYGVEASRAVFVDDSPANVAGAEAVGLTALRFTDAATLRADLHGLGLLGPGLHGRTS
ncbi:HAD family hydrolase [Georgenia alba]|uniref:HAD family hydrolase n=1 Tax=Georgenia alba TaxID=2233858 RepID=A0ABW2Q9K0_9MICO